MSIFDIPWWPDIIGSQGDARAMSQQEMASRDAAMAHLMVNARFCPNDWLLLQNYQPPIIVPQGWNDWYEFRDCILT